jgi:hypothetical protein
MSDTKRSKGSLLGHNSKIFYALAIASLAIIIGSVWSLSSMAVQTTNTQLNAEAGTNIEPNLLGESGQPPIPTNVPRVGVPMLVAYPLAMLPDRHAEVNESDYPWIARTIQYGETTIAEQEMKEYYDLYSIAKTPYFAVKSSDGSTKHYSIEFYEPPIILEQYNVKAYKLDVAPDKFITVRLEEQPWLEQLVEDSHTWRPVDNMAAKVLKQLSDVGQTFNFKVIHDDGQEEYYNLRYAGPALSTLS